MPPSNPNSSTNLEAPAGTDTKALWGDAQHSFKWRDKMAEKQAQWKDELHKRTVHKSLNIPLDGKQEEMQVTNTTTNHTGIGWKELGIGGIILAAASCFGMAVYARLQPPAQVPANHLQTPVSQPADDRDNIGLFEMDISGG